MPSEPTRRLTVKIPTEDFLALQEKIPWSMKLHVFHLICKDLALMLQDNKKRDLIIRAAINESLDIKEPLIHFTIERTDYPLYY